MKTNTIPKQPLSPTKEIAEFQLTPSYYKILSVTEFKYKDENFRGPDHEGDYFPSVLKSSNRLFTN